MLTGHVYVRGVTRSFATILADVLEQQARWESFDSPMGPNGPGPWAAAEALAVPEAVPFLIDILESGHAGTRFAVAALASLGPAARAASPALERIGEHLALWRVDEARARALGIHRRATPWRSGHGTTARAEIAVGMTSDEDARAHLRELLHDPDPEVVLFALDGVKGDSSSLFDRAWERPSSVPLPSLRPCLFHEDDAIVRAAARLVMRLHHPEDAEDVLAAWERTLVSPVDVAWLAPHPRSSVLYDHLSVEETFELIRRRRCAGLGVHVGGAVEAMLEQPPRDEHAQRYAERARNERRGVGPTSTLEAADERFVLGHHEDSDPDAAAYGRYASVLLAEPRNAYAAFQLAWIDRELGSPITSDRVRWLRALGVRDEALLTELATPVPPFFSGPRTRNKLVPGRKSEMRAHLERVRRATSGPPASPPRPAAALTPGPIETWRAPFRPPLELGDLQLDAFVVEHQSGTEHLDFRLEIGAGLGIYWALPADRNDRLRLVHVDGAAYELEKPELVADPWTADLGPLVWEGELATIEPGRTLVRVAFEASIIPPRYRCEIGLRDAEGRVTPHTFAWPRG